MITLPELLLLGLALVAFVVLAVGYAVRTPIWQNPDEPAHYTYADFVARTGGLPVLRPGDWDAELLERLKNGRLQAGDSVSAIRYENWQPPLFYLLAAPLLRVLPDDVPRQVLGLRLLNVAFGALTLGAGWLVAREVLSPLLASQVPLVLAGIPMFTAVSAAISADPLANLLAAFGVWLLLVWLRPSTIGSARWAIGAGGAIGVGVLAKVALATLMPLALVVLACKSQRRVRDAVLLLGTCVLVLVPWLVHQVSAYGWLDPLALNRHAAVVFDQPRFPGLTPEYLVDLGTTTFHSFWAQFGWMAIVAPDRLYWGYGLLTLAAVAGLVRGWRGLWAPPWRLVLGAVGLAVLAYVAYNVSFKQFQGRYLFIALAPIGVLLVAGWAAWLPERAKVWGVLLVGLALVGLNGYALARVLEPGFAPAGLSGT